MNETNKPQVSKCCKSSFHVAGGSEGTNWWKCDRCGNPTDPFVPNEEKKCWCNMCYSLHRGMNSELPCPCPCPCHKPPQEECKNCHESHHILNCPYLKTNSSTSNNKANSQEEKKVCKECQEIFNTGYGECLD